MCVEIQIKGGARIENCGQLWQIVGHDAAVYTHDADFRDYDCLCHVDVEATAKNAGYSVRDGWNEAAADYIWERKDGEGLNSGG